jgi:hypothetical protein
VVIIGSTIKISTNPCRSELSRIQDHIKAFGLWIYGDNQKFDISVSLREEHDQIQPFQLQSITNISWKGWRYLLFYLNYGCGIPWGRLDDGIIDYPVYIDSLLTILVREGATNQSTIYLTSPVVIS